MASHAARTGSAVPLDCVAQRGLGSGVTAPTSVALTLGGRSALERCPAVPRELLGSATPR